MVDKEVLFVGGGSCGLTGAWLLENQKGINVTLVEQGSQLGGHIATRRYQCKTELIDQEPTAAKIELVKSLHDILFIQQGDRYLVGYCNARGGYEQASIEDPSLLDFLRKTPKGVFTIEGDYIKQFNALLRQVNSCQRVTIYVVETGAEFIGDKRSYPLFNTICEHLGVGLRDFKLTAQFDASNGQTILLPPKLHGIEKTTRTPLFFKDKGQDIFNEFLVLFNTFFVDIDAKLTLKKGHPAMTLEGFVHLFIEEGGIDSIKQSRKEFADMFLYPLLAASWGVSIDDIKAFIAHYAMNYLSLGENWMDVPEGLDTYIQRMQSQCQRADIKVNTEVTKLEQVKTSIGVKYRARLSDGTYLKSPGGETKLFDHVVIAAPADSACAIMPDTPELAELKTILSRVHYYPTTIMTHRDPKYVSPEQYVVHTISTRSGDKIIAANTTCKYRDYDGEIPVLRSWVLPGQAPPNNVIEQIHFHHPFMSEAYYLAQQALHDAQGKQGVFFGNIISGYNDSNESTQSAAIRAAWAIRQSLSLEHEAASAETRLTQPSVTPLPTADRGDASFFDRFSLFREYLRTLNELEADSDQLGAGMPANPAEEKRSSLCTIL